MAAEDTAAARPDRYAKLSPKARKKAIARSYANVYKSRGQVKASRCSSCGSKTDVEMHHRDHGKPLAVKALCRTCHMKGHGQ